MLRIKLGLSISLTGGYSLQGRESFEGLSLWVGDVSGAGGIFVRELGEKVLPELVYYDDESSADKCRQIVERLITDDGVDILIGPYGSGHTLAAARAAESFGKTLWNHGGSSDEIFSMGFRHLVSAITPASRYLVGILNLVREIDEAARNLVIFRAEGSGFSENVAAGARLHARKLGFRAAELLYPSGTGDFTHLLKKASEEAPDVILGVGRADDDIALAGRMIELGIRVKAAGFVAAGIEEFGKILGRDAEGFLAPSQWEAETEAKPDFGPSAAEFARRFRQKWGKEPSYPAAQAYNIGLVIEKCIETAGSVRNPALRDAANGLEFNTFYGNFKIDPAAGVQIGHKIIIVQWRGGKKFIVYPPESAQGKALYPKP